jgi:HK97 family phage major capsid protein
MADVLTKGTLMDPELVTDLISKVRGESALAKLCNQTPIPFNGMKEFIFSMEDEVDIVAESGKKSRGAAALTPVIIIPVKFEYGMRTSDEFMYMTEEKQLSVLEQFNDGFSKKMARGIDLAAFHGVNPRTGQASTVVGGNNFDTKVTNTENYAAATADDVLDDAIAAVTDAGNAVTGIALSPAFGTAMGKIKVNGVIQYPEFRFGGAPAAINGMAIAVNRTVSDLNSLDRAIVGDFANMLKWGYAKEIPLEIIQYGDPDNSGRDLKGYNEVYIRAEAYAGWGILDAASFVRIVATA